METLEQLDALTEQYLDEREYQKAQDAAWQQLDIDKLREPAVRQLMTALAKSGQRSAAMAQYEIYSRRLDEALGVEPSSELAELYRSIQNEELQQTVLRSRIQVPADTGTINPIFCYTDIESSTRLWDEHRKAMFGALLQHNDLCETEIERFEGRILHPTGDGFLIVFEQNDPLQFAISLQQKFAEADWGEIEELRIRIGLHGTTADQEGHEFFREGGWYRGSILNHAARISDTGHGGQIVASPFVKEQCPLPPGASWHDLGQHGLKSLDDKQLIYGLMHPDLPIQSFPPLRTPDNKKAAQADGKIRGYQLGQKIGQGAFGDVYRAVQPGIGRPVAVKVIRALYANQPEFIRRFEAEAQVIARLEHPNIVPLYDYWRESDGAFLVMRFMRGGSLEGLLQSGPLELTTALSYLDQVGAALNFAHSQGYVHRDIKPANILLDEQGNAYLSDFGIVKDISSSSQQTQTGAVVGSPAYLSPEQALSLPVTMFSDQYSLAVTLYEMLTGERAFTDSSPATLIVKHLNEPLPLVRSARPELPAGVDECIQKATAKEPSARYPDILAMLRALHTATGTESSGYAMPTALLDPERELVNPYHGLRSFQEADAVNFFGRKVLVEQLLARFESKTEPLESQEKPIPSDRFLAVVGPSGSGKSSVVKAGLLPALRRGAVPGSEKWFIVEMIPGTHPLEELEASLLRIAVNPPDSMIRQLREDERGLVRALKRVLPADESELLLVIDQFEELYTLVEDDEGRTHFINSLLEALNDRNSRLRVVVTLRADFYDRPLTTPGLAELMRSCMAIVPPLTRAELEEVIIQPALQVGAMFEAGLVPAIVDEVGAQPGALPLLQYALTELFERRQERLLTLAAYEEIGGVLGALGRRAEELYAELDEEGEEAARQMFMRLVTLGEGTEDTRRRVLRSELIGLTTGVGAVRELPLGDAADQQRAVHEPPLQEVLVMDGVIDDYGRYRLLTFDHDPVTREPTVEVAHEALLREWERLRAWLDDSRDDVRLQRSLAAFAAEWSANEEDEGFLLHGSRLNLLTGWAASTTLALTPEEQAFLSASAAAREQRDLEERARQERELEAAQKLAATEKARAEAEEKRAEEQEAAAAGLRRRAYILGGVLVVAALLAIAAVLAGIQANNNAQTAVANANIAATQEAAASAAQAEALAKAEEAQKNADLAATAEAIAEDERTLAQENEAAAIAAQEEALAQAEIARFNEAQAQSLALTAGAKDAHSGGRVDLALALAVQAVDIEQPPTEAVRTLNDLAFSYGTQLIYENEDPDRYISRYIEILPVLPDGSTVISQDRGRTLTAWDSNSHEMLNQFDVANADVTFSRLVTIPDSTYIVTGYNNDEIVVWDWSTGEKVQTWSDIDMVNVNELLAGPEGNTVVYTSRYGGPETEVDGLPAGFNLTAWDIESGEEIYRFDGEHGERITWVEATLDNKTALLGTSLIDEEYEYAGGSRLRIVDLETGAILSEPALDELAGNNIISSMAINPAGDQAFLTTRDPDDWDAETSEFGKTGVFISLPVGEVVATAAFDDEAAYANYSPDGTLLAVERDTPSNNYFTLFDALTGEQLRQFGSANEGHIKIVNKKGFTFTPDGKRLVSADQGGSVLVWDVETGEIIQRLFGHGGESIFTVTVSPDGQTAISAGGGLLRFWDIAADTTAQVFEEHEADTIFGLAISPDGTKAISTGLFAPDEAANEAILWDTSTFEVIHRLPGSYAAAEFLPDGSSAVLGEDLDSNYPWEGDLEMALVHWDIESGELLNRTVIPDAAVALDIKISPDGQSIIAGTLGNSLVHFDIETFTLLNRLTSNDDAEWFISTAISPDGQTALAGGDLGDIILFDLESGEEIRRYSPGSVTAGLAMRADGEQFVSAGSDQTLVRWDLASGEAIQKYSGHTNEVTSVAFTADESQIISASADGTLILWDVASGEPLRTYSEHGVYVNNVVLSPDGQLAYSSADDGKVIVRPIVPLPIDEILTHIADNRVLHEFTCVERKQFRIFPLCDDNGVVPD